MVGLRSAANNRREQVEAGATAMSGLLPRVFLAVFALMSVPALWRSVDYARRGFGRFFAPSQWLCIHPSHSRQRMSGVIGVLWVHRLASYRRIQVSRRSADGRPRSPVWYPPQTRQLSMAGASELHSGHTGRRTLNHRTSRRIQPCFIFCIGDFISVSFTIGGWPCFVVLNNRGVDHRPEAPTIMGTRRYVVVRSWYVAITAQIHGE